LASATRARGAQVAALAGIAAFLLASAGCAFARIMTSAGFARRSEPVQQAPAVPATKLPIGTRNRARDGAGAGRKRGQWVAARAGAWAQLESLRSSAHWAAATAREHLSLLKPDPWSAYGAGRQSLRHAFRRLKL
jgi:hypothetical protein